MSIDYKSLSKNLAKENAILKDKISKGVSSKKIEELFQKFKDEELPDAESPYHYEAEIWSGMQSFISWLKNDR